MNLKAWIRRDFKGNPPQGAPLALCAAAILGLMALASGCSLVPPPNLNGHIVVVDAAGAPIQGAVLYPESEDSSTQPKYNTDEIKERSSDAQGVILVDLDEFFWESDGCYHFRFHRPGFDDATMSVSRDLFPQVLKVGMIAKAPAPAAKPKPAAAPAGQEPRHS